MTDLLIALIPSIMWGSLVLVSVKLGGTPYNQILGTTIGAFIFSILLSLYKIPQYTTEIFIVSFISGIFWTIGQMNQFISIRLIGVSKSVPISTGMCLISNSLFGVIVFKEWSTTINIVLGSVALLLITIGIFLISHEKSNSKTFSSNMTKAIISLLVSTAGFVAYVVILRFYHIDGWTAVLPQAIGMLVSAVVLTVRHRPYTIHTLKNVLTGFIWGTGNIGLLLSLQKIGIAVSYSLSQTGIIISTLGGIFLLREARSRKQIVLAVIGCTLVTIGGIVVGLTKI